MIRTSLGKKSRILWLAALLSVAGCFQASTVSAQTSLKRSAEQPLPLEQRAKINYDAYILGPGDGLQIELLDLPELSGSFSIGPDGTLYLPRLRALYAEGLTIEELRGFLTQQFKAYVRDPQVYVRPVAYRPIRIYVGGEVKRPGYYTLSGNQELSSLSSSAEALQLQAGTATTTTRPGLGQVPGSAPAAATGSGLNTFGAVFPTVFDAIRTAQGVTPYTNLAQVQVTRKRAQGLGGGRIRTNLNFLSLITEGNESQNIRLFDGDVVNVGRSTVVLREQLLKAGQTNLSPRFINVFVSGRVAQAGGVVVPQGANLTQAIDMAGGLKLLHGRVEFVRFTREGEIDRRVFNYNPGAANDDYRNPVLMSGDVIRVRESPISATVTVLNEVTGPAVGIYSVYSLFNGFE